MRVRCEVFASLVERVVKVSFVAILSYVALGDVNSVKIKKK